MKRLSRNDLLLLLMTVIWGANYTIVKVALQQIPPLAFNSLRLVTASLLFLATLAICRTTGSKSLSPPGVDDVGSGGLPAATALASAPPVFRRSHIAPRDWLLIALYGVIGHFIYQIFFLIGLAHTTVANSSLILGCSPVVVALFSAAAGHERVGTLHWVGAILSVCGIYLVVGHGATALGGASLLGDLLTIGGLFCWGVYTVGAKPLLEVYSPLEVTGYSMAFGTIPFVAMSIPELRTFDWAAVGGDGWAALLFSAVFALFVAYLIWYTAVQRLGNVRTSMYSNLTPVSALIIAVVWLGETFTTAKVVGAVAILAGMMLTRLVTPLPRQAVPAEE